MQIDVTFLNSFVKPVHLTQKKWLHVYLVDQQALNQAVTLLLAIILLLMEDLNIHVQENTLVQFLYMEKNELNLLGRVHLEDMDILPLIIKMSEYILVLIDNFHYK